MADRVYKKIAVTGCSHESMEKAVELAVAKAGENLRGLSWFEVKEIRGGIAAQGGLEWQVTVEIGFKVD